MEYIEYEYNFGAFREFLENHEGVLFHEDYYQYVLLAIQHKNIKVLKYIIDHKLLENWNDCIALLYEYEMKECLEMLLKNNIDINCKNESNTLLDYAITNYITKKDNEDDKLKYLIYIIENNGKLNIEKFCGQIRDGIITDDNIQKIVYSIDLLLLYNVFNEKINLDTEELQLLFQNMDKDNKELLENIDEYFINILKTYYNTEDIDSLFLCINKLSIINKSTWIDTDLFIYHDGKQNWCFSKEDVKYIKNTKMNPLNDTKMPEYIITLM
tara:strand:+ start:135 stop:944 length:810 start_codon:yes stop_codon:yes gene_type:complete